jgi:hypothetical protein
MTCGKLISLPSQKWRFLGSTLSKPKGFKINAMVAASSPAENAIRLHAGLQFHMPHWHCNVLQCSNDVVLGFIDEVSHVQHGLMNPMIRLPLPLSPIDRCKRLFRESV